MAYQFRNYIASDAVNEYKNRQDAATNRYNNYANFGYHQGLGGYGQNINSAQDRLNQLYSRNNLSQQFRYSNQGQYNKALKDITNRNPFSYDLSNDTLFQQAKEQYQTMGKTAMADTIGQASAMTGGYGNSYAATAGQQAYNAYLQELNNSIGDYYSMALSSYNNETDRLNGVFNALSSDRTNEQNEWAGNWNVYNNLYNMYSQELQNYQQMDQSAWQQQGTNLYQSANLATSQYSTESTNDRNTWSQSENLRAEQAQQEETERANRAEEAYRNAQLAETIRSNKANEAYNLAQLNTKSSQSSESSQSSDNYKDQVWYGDSVTRAWIDKIDNEAQTQVYRNYNGDMSAARKAVAKEILSGIKDDISNDEYDYIQWYYNSSKEKQFTRKVKG